MDLAVGANEAHANLTELLEPAAIDITTLRARYGGLLELVRKLIGVIPNCDRYLEIWPPAFRTYNVMVPNLLELPVLLWAARKRRSSVALGMYAASRAAECMYCSAHTCEFALRRGVAAGGLDLDGGDHSPGERAAIAVARAISRIPATITDGERAALRAQFSEGDVEWIVLGAAMMGYLNKFMDALGVELETETVGEVSDLLAPSGWSVGRHDVAPAAASSPLAPDGLGLKVGVVRYLPGALALDRKWTAGVPARWPAIGELLRERTGYDFPVLGRLRHRRAIRAIATMIRESGGDGPLGAAAKHEAGLIYAIVAGDAALADGARTMATHAGAPSIELDAAERFAAEPLDLDDAGAITRAARVHGPALVLARAVSTSPARVTAPVVRAASALPPAAIVELVSWIGVLQLVHRLHAFYG
jgi:hypothetical protein